MPRIVFSERALTDLERIIEFLREQGFDQAETAVETILDALAVLERHPSIGRPVDNLQRELVIGFGQSGYVALYRHRPAAERVDILAVRHQRRAGYG